MKKKNFLIVILTVVVLVFAAACGSPSSQKGTTGADTENTQENSETMEQADAAEEAVTDSSETQDSYLDDVVETEVAVSLGTSDLYTEDELEKAVEKIKEDFASWKGCELHSLRYAGDDLSSSQSNIEWINSLGDGTKYTQAAEFLGDFHSSEDGSMFEPDHEYKDYHWWLGKNNNGDWDLVIAAMDEDSSENPKTDNTETDLSENDKETIREADGYTIVPTEGSMYCTADIGVNVRSGFSTDDQILGVIHFGDRIPVTGTVQKDGEDQGWLQVEYNGQTAYVSSEFLSTQQPAGELETSEEDK